MNRLIRTELLKQRCTPTFLIGAAVVPVLAAVVTVAMLTAAGHQGNAPLGPHSLMDVVAAPASAITAVALILGVLAMAGEYRHQTVTTTYLATPRRRQVMGAKLAASAITGSLIGLATIAVTTTIAIPWLQTAGVAVHIDPDLVRTAAALVMATILHGALGVAIGALIRNQTAAIAVVLVWLLALEGILANVFGSATFLRWLPAAAGRAIVHAGTDRPMLAMSPAAVVFTAYVATFAVAGTRLTLNRDVT